MKKTESLYKIWVLRCRHCRRLIHYRFFDGGWSDQDFYYCDSCATIAVIDGQTPQGLSGQGFYQKYLSFLNKWDSVEAKIKKKLARKIKKDTLTHLQPCSCGGHFSDKAQPRCPHCNQILRFSDFADQLSTVSSDPAHFKAATLPTGWHGRLYFIFEGKWRKNPWKIPESKH